MPTSRSTVSCRIGWAFFSTPPHGKASKLVAASTQRMRYVAVDTGLSMLIHPDSCIAWADEQNSTDGLEEALRRWFIPYTVMTG